MLDEWMEQKVDEACEVVPAYVNPRKIRLASSHIGWRLYLYGSSLKRAVSGFSGSIPLVLLLEGLPVADESAGDGRGCGGLKLLRTALVHDGTPVALRVFPGVEFAQ